MEMRKNQDSHSFLSPVYLNEQMVLSCAAYLFEGIEVHREVVESTTRGVGGKAGVKIPLLSKLLGAEGDIRTETALENKIVRQYTVGGLHMSILNELRKRGMLHSSKGRASLPLGLDNSSYLDVEAILRPTDYYSILSTLKVLGPLVSQILRDHGDRLINRGKGKPPSSSQIRQSAERYERSIMSIVDQLEHDYLTSRQIEMVMWSNEDKSVAFGVADVEVGDYNPAELRAKLSDGNFHIIGKITRSVREGQSINLLQKSALFNAVKLLQEVITLSDPLRLNEINSTIVPIWSEIRRLATVEISGPAVRVLAMSVCV
jgi:hypothetical protein